MMSTAYHEAGHGVVALRLCHAWSSLSISDDGGGLCRPVTPGLLIEFREPAIRAAAVYCAGPIAEAVFTGGPVVIEAGDLEGLVDVVDRFPDDPRFRATAERLARRCLARHWAEVQLVAEHLAERRYLSPMDLAGIITLCGSRYSAAATSSRRSAGRSSTAWANTSNVGLP